MKNLPEDELKIQLDQNRVREMDKYGRTQAYKELNELLDGDVRDGFNLVNHALTIVDDVLDGGESSDRLNELSQLLMSDSSDETLHEKWTGNIIKLRKVLDRLEKSGFKNTHKIREEVINFWKADHENLKRRLTIVDEEKLDYLNTEIGRSIAAQFLYFLTPDLDESLLQRVSTLYGQAIKIADNLSDLDKDLSQGLINISKEDLENYDLTVEIIGEVSVIKGSTIAFKRSQFEKSIILFAEAEKLLAEASKDDFENEKLKVFSRICKSWLDQAGESLLSS